MHHWPYMRSGLLLLLAIACGKAGRGEFLATWPFQPLGMAVEPSGIYAIGYDSTIARVSLDGGISEVLGSALTVGNADPPVLTDEDVAWTIQGNVLDGGAVLAVSKTGGTPRALASSQPQPRFLTKDDHTGNLG